jgi:virulence-associated protein VapD
MSKEDAIKILAAIRSDAIQGSCYVTESSAEALEMAIEALKEQLQER